MGCNGNWEQNLNMRPKKLSILNTNECDKANVISKLKMKKIIIEISIFVNYKQIEIKIFLRFNFEPRRFL
jgi:hypothetical protein